MAGADDLAQLGYKAVMPDGATLTGTTDADGATARFSALQAGKVKVLIGDDDWTLQLDSDESLSN